MKPSSLLALALAAMMAAAPLPSARGQINLPALGDSASDDFGPGTERRLGDQIMAEVRRDAAYLDDPLLLDYTQSLWAPLVAAARQRGDLEPDTDRTFAWEVFLVDDRTVNAFALPGGFVGVHLGLIALTAQRDELASVLAHELAHVTQRHIARSIALQQRRSVVGMAAVILAMIAASRAGNADLAQAAMLGGQAALVQGQLNYSRDMEREADRIGFGTFVAAGFAPAGMAQMFERLQGAVRLMDDNGFPYLRSHPLTVERIAEARSRVEGLPVAPPSPALLEHPLMQARARVLMDRTDTGLARQQAQRPAESATPAERLGLWYGSALAALLRRDLPAAAAALAQVEAILQASPLREPATARLKMPVLLLQAQSKAAGGDAAGAVAMIDASGLAATHRPAMLARAQVALQAVRAAEAARTGGEALSGARARLRESTEALQTWVAERREDALAWSQLSQCAGQLGLALRAVRAEAEARAAVGDVLGAIDRLRAAQALARDPARADFVELSVIDARLRELRALRQSQIAEQRANRLGAAPFAQSEAR